MAWKLFGWDYNSSSSEDIPGGCRTIKKGGTRYFFGIPIGREDELTIISDGPCPTESFGIGSPEINTEEAVSELFNLLKN